MRTIATACFWVIIVASYCNAQMSVNPDWRERNGLTVASSQTVSVPAKILRGFVTIESVDVDARNAIAIVSAKKKAAVDALKAIEVPEKSIKTTSTRIPGWDTTPQVWNFYGSNTHLQCRTSLQYRIKSDEQTNRDRGRISPLRPNTLLRFPQDCA